MPTSQFTIYSSNDVNGPGYMTGEVGRLLTILDACLVNGYTGKSAAGWSKPIANSGNIGCYKQGAGSMMTVLINDNAPNGTPSGKEAWATGWESLSSITGPVGTGFGQFPLPAQLLTTGHVVIRKSASADGVVRPWVIFADSRTFYLFILTADITSAYTNFGFGDLFSLKGASDVWCCQIIGRNTENSPVETSDFMFSVPGLASMNPVVGSFIARTFSGGGQSITRGQNADSGKLAVSSYISGSVPCPNGPDNSIYVSPIVVHEPVGNVLRGRMRGLYQVCHPSASFSDGQTFHGIGDYSGKIFQIIKNLHSGQNSGNLSCFAAVEISNTVETN